MSDRTPTFVEEAAGNTLIDLGYLRARRAAILALAEQHHARDVRGPALTHIVQFPDAPS